MTTHMNWSEKTLAHQRAGEKQRQIVVEQLRALGLSNDALSAVLGAIQEAMSESRLAGMAEVAGQAANRYAFEARE